MKRLFMAAISALVLMAGPARATSLPNLNADITQSSVSGLSSGAFMAVQFHVAFSGSLIGAGVVAGGPYDCASGLLANAVSYCTQALPTPPNPAALASVATWAAAYGNVDPLSNLATQKVYVFSGTQDHTVNPAVDVSAVSFYELVGVPDAQVSYVSNLPAGHAFITNNYGNACGVTAPPYVNNCGYDQAGAILQWIYGPLNAPASSPTGQTIAFSQSEFLSSPTTHGMATTGYLYVPTACQGSAGCRVHIAFHGCAQNAAAVGDAFYAHAGYNTWADTNRLIILYPQTYTIPGDTGNKGCWDWWGYDDAYYATKWGNQMAAVDAMLLRLTGN